MQNKFILIATLLFTTLMGRCIISVSGQTPAKPNKKSILILNGTAHIGNGQLIENSAIGIKNNQLVLVGNASQRNIILSEWDTIIDAKQKHIYPGFISTNTTIGLTEIDAVRASLDFNEIGEYNPNVRALVAFNTDSKIIPTVRSNGVLIAQSVPKGGIIAGKSSIFNLDGWNWEDAVLTKDDGIWLEWPKDYTYQQTDDGNWEYGKNKQHDKQVDELNTFFKKAKAYHTTKEKIEIDVRLEALKEIFTGNKNLYIIAQRTNEILEAISFIKLHAIKKPVLVGAQDILSCINEVKEMNIPVILERIHRLPPQADDDINYYYTLPLKLFEQNVLFCLSYSGDMEAMGSRNLPFTAGTSVAYGLPKEEAIKAITYNAALILGIQDKVGTLEEGKLATLFISNGDALDMKTNQVIAAFINGAEIDLTNHQKELYKKYAKKYGLDKTN